MKFQRLPLGARFEFEGKVYTKTGPMTASGPSGEQKMIPRYAELAPLDGGAMPAQRPQPTTLKPEHVETAFDAFYSDAASLVGTDQLGVLATARERFFQTLGMMPGAHPAD
jgi:hypothetical protein